MSKKNVKGEKEDKSKSASLNPVSHSNKLGKNSKGNTDMEKIQDLTGLLQRVQADFDNYKKRVDRQIEQDKNRAKAEVIIQILPILDSFELALKSQVNSQDKDKQGLELIYGQLFSVLENLGLRVIDCLLKVDPYKHEVLLQVESEQASGTILEVLQKGFMLNEMVIRTAKVKVAKQKINSDSVNSDSVNSDSVNSDSVGSASANAHTAESRAVKQKTENYGNREII